MKKKILISNDDGVHAPGIQALAERFQNDDEVYVVAPLDNKSAASLSLTLRQPLRIQKISERTYGVSGTPADCVHMALHQILDFKPDFVLSGINAGGNIGRDTLYSGTVAATVAASFQKIPGLAVSIEGEGEYLFKDAAEFTYRLVQQGLCDKIEPGKIVNLNIPNLPIAEIKELRTASLGNKAYTMDIVKNKDPRGGEYYWIGGTIDTSQPKIPNSDGDLLLAGHATLSVLNPTYQDTLATEVIRKELGLSEPLNS